MDVYQVMGTGEMRICVGVFYILLTAKYVCLYPSIHLKDFVEE